MEFKLKPEVREMWATALESGLYKQGKGGLRHVDGSTNATSHCCLGVLCDLYKDSTGVGAWTSPLKNFGHSDDGYCEFRVPYGQYVEHNPYILPRAVAEWAFEVPPNGEKLHSDYQVPEINSGRDVAKDTVASLNDSGEATFSDIARIVRTQL